MSGCYGEIETQAGDSSLVVMAFYYYYLKQSVVWVTNLLPLSNEYN